MVLVRTLACLCRRNILYSAFIFIIASKKTNVYSGPLLRVRVRIGVVMDLLLGTSCWFGSHMDRG
jgi:hypothetical protein